MQNIIDYYKSDCFKTMNLPDTIVANNVGSQPLSLAIIQLNISRIDKRLIYFEILRNK